jgi:hypothetical protein
MEEVKRENEMLKQRIRELERTIRGHDADGQRGRTGAPPAEMDTAGASNPESTSNVTAVPQGSSS